MVPPAFIAALSVAFILGTFLGSFLNVCIHRLPRNESISLPPSRCYACGTRIRWYDNLPIVGYLLLRGRCRACGTGYSSRYLWAEVLFGLLTAATTWYVLAGGVPVPNHGPEQVPAFVDLVAREAPRFAQQASQAFQPTLIPAVHWGMPIALVIALALTALLPLVCFLFVAAMIDRAHEIIPDELTVPFQLAAPILAALATTPFAIESALPLGWLLVRAPGGGIGLAGGQFLATSWLVAGGTLALLALTLVTLGWVYGPRLGSEAWSVRDQKTIRTGFWWFAGCMVVALVVASLVLLVPLLASPGEANRLGFAGFFAVGLVQAVLGSLMGWALPWLVGLLGSAALRKNAMGYGDVKFLAPIGAFLGPVGVLYAFFLAAIVGTIIGVPKLILTGSRRLRFGPCLAIGTVLVLAAGPLLHQWFAGRLVLAWSGG